MMMRYMIFSEVFYFFTFTDHFPLQTKNISNNVKSKLWISPGILATGSRKRHLEKNTPESRTIITEYRRHIYLLTKVTGTASVCIAIIFMTVFFGSRKKVWININNILCKKRKSSSISIILNSIIINEPYVINSSFTSYFNNIPTTLSNNIFTFENYLVDQIPEAENFQLTSIAEITKIITNIKTAISLHQYYRI